MADDDVRLPDDVVVLGGQMAAALAAQGRHFPPGPSPLHGVTYPAGSGDLWRWREWPQDAVVAEFVESYGAVDDHGRVDLRARLTIDDFYTLLLFTRRRALAAVRASDSVMVGQAFDALSAIDIERVDWRDVLVGAWLAAYAAQSIGASAAALSAEATRRASSEVSDIISRAASDLDTDFVAATGYRMVSTSDGPVFLADGYQPDDSDQDLGQIALAAAAAIEAEGTYLVSQVSIGTTIPAIWAGAGSDNNVAAALGRITGCSSVHTTPVDAAGIKPGEHFLTVYLAQTATAQDACYIAAGTEHGSRPGSQVVGVAVDRFCVVVVAACVMGGQPTFETAESLARFKLMIVACL